MSNTTAPFMQTGAALLTAALRDPAPIVSGESTWNFIQVTDKLFTHLTEDARNSEPYQTLLGKKQAILEAIDDFTPQAGGNRLGERLIEAFAAYIEQAGKVVPLLEEQTDEPHVADLFHQFEQVMTGLTQEIAEVPPQHAATHDALAAFLACRTAVKAEQGTSTPSTAARNDHAT